MFFFDPILSLLRPMSLLLKRISWDTSTTKPRDSPRDKLNVTLRLLPHNSPIPRTTHSLEKDFPNSGPPWLLRLCQMFTHEPTRVRFWVNHPYTESTKNLTVSSRRPMTTTETPPHHFDHDPNTVLCPLPCSGVDVSVTTVLHLLSFCLERGKESRKVKRG